FPCRPSWQNPQARCTVIDAMFVEERRAMKLGWSALDGVSADRLWLRPSGLISGRAAAEAIASGHARPLTGSGLAFSLVAVLGLGSDRRPVSLTSSIAELEVWIAGVGARFGQRMREQLSLLSAQRPPWVGFDLDRPVVMGVLNVTPDSFSDGGQWFDTERAVTHGRALLTAGADIIDVGGESTRPGAGEIHPGEETLRVEPVVRALAESGAAVSIDTRHTA